MIFRWSFWGTHKGKHEEMLRYSILSFKKYFKEGHLFIVYTDNSDEVSDKIKEIAEVRDYPSSQDTLPYCIESKATWGKWCPSARLDVTQDECSVDSDVFLLKRPEEVDFFLFNPKLKFAILDEFYGQPFQHGAMHKKATEKAPYVNAGFFIQKAGHDISVDLLEEFHWWKEHIPSSEQTHHDEQGALTIALSKYFMDGELCIFPKNKYMLIGPNENTNIQTLDNVVLFHAVYSDHPAFYKFKNTLDQVLF